MTHLKLTDKVQIGKIDFEAYIIKDENNIESFAIYFQKAKEPLILFQQNDVKNQVEIKINQQLVKTIQHLKSKDSVQRKEHFKRFQEFVLDAEQTVKEFIFQDKKLDYITDVQLIKSTEKAYLAD